MRTKHLFAAALLLLSSFYAASAQQLASGVTRVADVVIYSDTAYFSAFPSVVQLDNGDLWHSAARRTA